MLWQNKDAKKAAEVDKNILENEIKPPVEEKIQNLEDKGSDSKAKVYYISEMSLSCFNK